MKNPHLRTISLLALIIAVFSLFAVFPILFEITLGLIFVGVVYMLVYIFVN
jgi:hypothetical protein